MRPVRAVQHSEGIRDFCQDLERNDIQSKRAVPYCQYSGVHARLKLKVMPWITCKSLLRCTSAA
eukprot:264965-Amphidinium_carterae.1